MFVYFVIIVVKTSRQDPSAKSLENFLLLSKYVDSHNSFFIARCISQTVVCFLLGVVTMKYYVRRLTVVEILSPFSFVYIVFSSLNNAEELRGVKYRWCIV